MKKLVISLILATSMAALAQSSQSTDDSGDIGLGYQGLFMGDFFNGISVRYAPANVPMIAQLLYCRFSGDIDGDDGHMDLIQGRLAYVLKERTYSTFYVGGKVGYINGEMDEDSMDGFTYGPLFGTEFHFAEIPELGFNFDVGYDFNNIDFEDTDSDVEGVNVTFGAHYYF